MSDTEARRTVWAIEAFASSDAKEKPLRGSAIAVSLKTADKGWRKYLLTCSHVVKQFSAGNPRTASGPLRSVVLAYAPQQGYIPWRPGDPLPDLEDDGIYTGKLIDIFERPADQWTQADCKPSLDWVLIDITESNFQDNRAAKFAYSLMDDSGYSVIGYPGSTSVFRPGQVVEPKISKDFRLERTGSSPGILLLDGGDESGAGMSGGGVFNDNGQLVGLYFGQNFLELSRNAIDVRSIVEQLEQAGYKAQVDDSREHTNKFNGWVRDFKSWPALISKIAGLAAILSALALSTFQSIAPAWPSASLLSFSTTIIVLVVMILSALIPRSILNYWARIALLVACAGSLVACGIFYSLERQRLVYRFGADMVTVGIDNSPSSLVDVIQPLETNSPPTADLFTRWQNPTDIWTEAAMAKSRKRLLFLWTTCFALLGAISVLFFKTFQKSENL